VRTVFEAARTGSQCLVVAYERLVPIPCRPTRLTARNELLSGAAVATKPLTRRRAERG
jgi:hypothetical protein